MKRVLLGWAAMLAQSMAVATGFDSVPGKAYRGKRQVYGNAYYSSSRPKAARWWHDISNPAQGLRFDAAVTKRERKAEKLKTQTLGMWNNKAHTTRFAIPGGGTTMGFPARLNPFYQPPVAE